jgi:universal stress protein E
MVHPYQRNPLVIGRVVLASRAVILQETFMSTFSRVLAVTDLSNPARHAAQRAALFCREASAELDLLHVVQFAPLQRMRKIMGATLPGLEAQVLNTAKDKMRELATELERLSGVSARVYVAQGSLLAELSRQAHALKDGLLVCGARGESIVRHFVLGTTALRLLNVTPCTVLVVKQPPHQTYKSVLISVDFSPSSVRSIEQALSIAPDARFALLHAFEAPFEGQMRYASVDADNFEFYQETARREAHQKLQDLRDQCGLSPENCRLVLVHGNPALRIVQYEVELDADLLVMGKHGESLVEELFLGSVTKHVLGESQCDMLISA